MVTATIGKDHYRTEILATNKIIVADEPEEVGGKNEGPSPGEFLLISLASCTAITLRMYADRKKWEVDNIRVEVASERSEWKTTFTRHIYLDGGLTEEQRQRLLEIANACPVHKVLSHPIEINTQLL
ncbi:MAG TPA: OsmC family protein [Cyclobacteriaceae bacterium]|jgi:putative redox protein|nr:OsmC family protein [Cyclobacteriaceae bacterium]